MLYDSSYRSEYYVEANDVLVIPFRQYFVTVAKPGRYPYMPDRDWEYYIALAGGFDPVRNMLVRGHQ
jgi:protein involved in polysaccharide export with SLBB domain